MENHEVLRLIAVLGRGNPRGLVQIRRDIVVVA